MSKPDEAGWMEASVDGLNDGEQITFRRSNRLGELVEVMLGNETIRVRAESLLAAVRLMQPDDQETGHTKQ
jgi:hypothetical protein